MYNWRGLAVNVLLILSIWWVGLSFSCIIPLTHWGRDKMAAVSQTALSNAFSWMKMLEFRLRFHWCLFLRFELTIFQHWFRYWLGAGQATSHYLNQCWPVYWRIYASLGLNELKGKPPFTSPALYIRDLYYLKLCWNLYQKVAIIAYAIQPPASQRPGLKLCY